MTTSNSDHGKGITTAFSNGTSQTLQNASVLNAGGNITYFNFGDFMQSDDNNSSFVESSKSDVDVEADNRKTLAYKSLSYVLSLLWSSHKEPQEIAKLPSEIPGGSSPIEVTSESYRSEMRRLKSEDNNGTSEEQAVVVISSNEHEFPPLEALLHAPSSYEIYVEKMFPLKYGYPLWLPQPDRNFPIEYRRKGVSIGDVGCISPDGSFDFLFNIWTPVESPIHVNGLPDGFESMSPPSSGTTSKELFSYRGMVTSFANVDRELDRNTMDVTYSFNDEDKGSLLYMPVGAFQDDYIEVGQLKSFITKNAESWYRYAIAKCGRVLDRHSLYLVTGCLKSRSWGIVTWDTAIPKRHSTLVIGLSPDPVGPAYEWKRVVNATTFRTGPTSGPTTNTETRLSDTENQCLFVRGYKISLSEEVWNSINEDPQEDEALDKDGNGNADSKNLNTGERRKANFRSNEDTPSEDPPSKFHNKYEVSLTNLSEKPNPLHPLNAINDVLLAQVSGSHVAITHDNEWWTAVEGCHNHGNKQDHGFNIQNFQRSLKSQYVIRYDEGTKACTLEPRDIDHTQHDNDKFAFTSVYTEESPNSTEAPPLTVQSSSTSTSSMLGGDSQAKGEYTTAQQKLPSAINFRSLPAVTQESEKQELIPVLQEQAFPSARISSSFKPPPVFTEPKNHAMELMANAATSIPHTVFPALTVSPAGIPSEIRESSLSALSQHSSSQNQSRLRKSVSDPELKRSSSLLNVDEEHLMILLVTEAVEDSCEYKILSAEEVKDLKKEEEVLTFRLTAMSKKVSLEIKIRDAATTLSDVKASHKKVSKQTEKQLDVANKRVEAAQKDLWRISEQVNQVQKKLLEHRAGVLSASQVRNTEEKMNSPSNHHTYMSPMDSKVASPLSTMNSSFTLPQKRSFNDTRETINTFWREIPRLEKLDAEVEQLLKDRGALDGESKEPGKQLEVLQARLASLELQAAAEIVGGKGFTELRAQLKGKRQGSHLDRTFDDNDIHELRQLQDEMGYLRLEDKAALDKANHELNAATTALGDIIKEHGITLYSRDEGLPGMLKRVRMYFAGLHNKLEAHAKEAIEWDGMRKRFEDNEQSHLEEREALMRELESVRNQLETAKAEKMTMQSKQTKLADTISALHSSAIGSLPHNQDSAPHSDSDISKDVSILLSTWDILPSPAARAAIYYASYSDRDEFYPMPSESVTHLPDSGLCFLKVLYNKQENPDWHEPRNDTFTVKALSDRVQVMLKDVRALIEKLERVTRSSKPPSKDFERAQKLLKERELTIEAQQRQVKMLEERNISFAARQAEMQEEIQRLQDDIEHATEGKQEAKMLDTEPGETAVNIALERRGSQLSKYRDELQVAHGEVDTVKNSNQPQGTSWLDYHDAAQTRNNALGTPTNTSGKK